MISVGGYVTLLLAKAKTAARQIGAVTVDMGETACKVPDALAYIEKMESMGRIGKKTQNHALLVLRPHLVAPLYPSRRRRSVHKPRASAWGKLPSK